MKLIAQISFIFLLNGASLLFSQTGDIKGRLLDEPGSPVPGANVSIPGTVLGCASDDEGYIHIRKIPQGEYTLAINVIGYGSKHIPFTTTDGQTLDLGDIILTEMPLQLQPLVVTASKYEQNMQDVPVSMSTVTKDDLAYRHTVSVEKAIQYVPGINMNADQVNIRGSNGYSRGVGSRVMMLVDGMPYITGDTQGIIFEAMPVNQVERLEIIKGAGSALYGSSAMGGVINIITKSISEQPRLHVHLYGGMHSDPYYPEWKWSDESRFMNGLNVDYSGKAGNVGTVIAASRDEDDSYRKNDWRRRYNLSGKLVFDLSPYDQWTLSGNYMDQKRNNFLYWKGLNNALEPPDNQIGEHVWSQRYYMSSAYRKVIDHNTFYKVNMIWFHNHFEDNIGEEGHRADSDFFHSEFQYTSQFKNHVLTMGVTPTYNRVSSDLFGSHAGFGVASYIQDEIAWSQKVMSTLGARLDYFDVDELGSDYQLNPRFGVVFKPVPGTSIRASAGTGFRAPSIAEAFTSTEAGGLPVRPNPELTAEKSVSIETGWNQEYGDFLVSDIALFYNRFRDMIEGGFYRYENLDYIRFDNVMDARIIGMECTLNSWLIRRMLYVNMGYTYIDPQNLTSGDFLNYRPRHLFYSGLQGQYRRIRAGMDYRLISRYDRIDEDFGRFIKDYDERVTAHIVDFRLSTELWISDKPLTLSFQINNLFQYHYVDLIGSIAPIRHFVITLDAVF